MVEGPDKRRRDRAYQSVFMKSYKRLKKRGADDEDAGAVAREVADRSTGRMKAPVFHTDEEFAALVGKVCAKLAEGQSYYELIGELPFLATGRTDRVVAVALRTRPPVEPRTARLAKRATALERMSGGVAVLLMSLALGMLGLWYAIGVGVVVCVATEVYIQAWMPRSLRLSTANYRVPAVVFAAATVALVFQAYRWYQGVLDHMYLYGFVAAVAVVLVGFIIPGLTLAQLVSRRERRWRRDLEQALLDKRQRGAGER
ncbi:MAG: hypothetical protein A2133_07915 [Actinobacteria bacterium RBG_16_64_13]|nr:MAG: hypothetical protein A2133_07915 [Actinobacteria bacterium RBG_16_64_13]